MIRRAVGLCALGIVIPTAASPQQIGAGATLQTFTFASGVDARVEQVQLLSAPFAAAWALSSLELGLTGAYADGIVTVPGGGHIDISGPTDAQFTARYSLGVFSATGFFVIPAGDATYGSDEILLLGALASELLPFAVEGWGSGGGLGGEASISARLGGTVVDVTGGYVAPRPYTPLENSDVVYRPGRQVRVKAAVDARMGRGGSISVRLGMQRFATDAYGPLDLFMSGIRWEGVAAISQAVGAREIVSARAGMYVRTGSSLRGVPGFAELQLPGLVGTGTRRLFVLGAEAQFSRNRFALLPGAELRVLSTSDGIGDGWLAAIGATFDYRLWGGMLGRRLIVAPNARLLVGSAGGPPASRSGVSGWEAGMTLRWEAGR